MKKKMKHKKQHSATHPTSESDRIENLKRTAANPEKPTLKLKFNMKLRELRTPSDVEETSDLRIDKKISSIWW